MGGERQKRRKLGPFILLALKISGISLGQRSHPKINYFTGTATGEYITLCSFSGFELKLCFSWEILSVDTLTLPRLSSRVRHTGPKYCKGGPTLCWQGRGEGKSVYAVYVKDDSIDCWSWCRRTSQCISLLILF